MQCGQTWYPAAKTENSDRRYLADNGMESMSKTKGLIKRTWQGRQTILWHHFSTPSVWRTAAEAMRRANS